MRRAAAYIALGAAAIGCAWAAQASVAFRYFAAAAIVLGAIAVLFRPRPLPDEADTVADFTALKRERTRLIALQAKARQENWTDDAQTSVATDLAQVEQRLGLYR